MRATKEEAAKTRARIVKTAGRIFRDKGFAGAGVEEVMAAAGLTRGGFYRHFPSKDALAAEACAAVIRRTGEEWRKAAGEAGPAAYGALLARYLTTAHRDQPELGCIFAALGADAGRRADPVLTQVFADGLDSLTAVLADVIPDADAKRAKALTVLAALVGALVLARASAGQPISDEV
ncbi:MAG TPA: TetR/AcrR family transcriptional regulator, partial [Azospirillaceae bacterium]|nr:TetR/AcrR family transcriptional regulator [Azospirillaceae bacterium]